MNRWLEENGQWLALVAVFVALVWLLAPMLTPFVFAALFGWMGDPLVDRLELRGWKRGNAVLFVFAVLLGLLAIAALVLLPLLWTQLERLFLWLPHLAAWITEDVVPWVQAKLHVDLSPYVDPSQLAQLLQQHWEQAGGLAAGVLGGLSRSSLAILEAMVQVALVPVLGFYFLRDWDIFVARVGELVPRPWLGRVSQLARDSDRALGGFVRGQMSVMVTLGLIYGFGLWLVGVDLGPLIGFVAGLISFVPYLGAFFGVAFGIVATLVQHGDVTHLALVLLVFVVGHLMESFVLTPWLVGDRIGLHPVAVIFAIMAGGHLFGFLGVLLALPVTAVAMVGLRHAHGHYKGSGLYGAPSPAPVLPVQQPPERPDP